MKKFILFFVLILGYISEGKAQFATSSEIHYYVYVGSDKEYNRNVDEVIVVKFDYQTMKMSPLNLSTLKIRKNYYLSEITNKINSRNNNDYETLKYEREKQGDLKYFGGNEYRYRKEDRNFEYIWHISKDKALIVERVFAKKHLWDNIDYFLNGGFVGGEFYYQKIDKESLINMDISTNSKKQNSSNYKTEIHSSTIYNNNDINRTSSGSNYNSSGQRSTGTWITKQCTACNGTGKSIAKNYAPNYGGTRTKSYCNICNGYEYPHSHKTCGICKGKGYVKEYKY